MIHKDIQLNVLFLCFAIIGSRSVTPVGGWAEKSNVRWHRGMCGLIKKEFISTGFPDHDSDAGRTGMTLEYPPL